MPAPINPAALPHANRNASASSSDSAMTPSSEACSPPLALTASPTNYFAPMHTTAEPASTNPHPSPTFLSRLRQRSRSPSYRRRHQDQPASPPLGSPRSPSDPFGAPTSQPQRSRPRGLHIRSESATLPSPPTTAPLGTVTSGGSTAAAVRGSQPRSTSRKRHSGTMMQVGRHSNDWLFGGFSITQTVKGVWSPRDEGGH